MAWLQGSSASLADHRLGMQSPSVGSVPSEGLKLCTPGESSACFGLTLPRHGMHCTNSVNNNSSGNDQASHSDISLHLLQSASGAGWRSHLLMQVLLEAKFECTSIVGSQYLSHLDLSFFQQISVKRAPAYSKPS